MRNKLLVGALALAMTCTTVFSGVAPATVKAASVSTVQTQAAENSDEYVYCYAGLTWAEYWKSEGVYNAENIESSDEVDRDYYLGDVNYKEHDKGGFDAVTRATTNHGLHRGSYQCTSVIKGNNDNYYVSYWTSKTNAVLTDGSTITFNGGTIVKADGSTDTMTEYDVLGIKYVPVAVKRNDFSAFKKNYSVVENTETLKGGCSEGQLSNYTDLTADVNANTNGLKIATQNSDGSFSFSARKTGSTSGIASSSLASISLDDLSPSVNIASGKFGEFLRVDFTKQKSADSSSNDGYGALGAKMQAVKWTYYGSDSTRSTALRSFGTKFAADNWMHSSQGIQLGLTDSYRCQLPDNTSGTGYWRLTIYALGYADSTYDFVVNSENIVGLVPAESDDAKDISKLATTVASAEKLNKDDYTVESWTKLESALQTAKAQIINPTAQTAIDAANSDLEAAIKALAEKPAATTTEKKNDTTTASKPNTTTAKKTATKPALKKSNVKLSKPVLKIGKKTTNKVKVTWKKISKATGYEIQYTTKTFSNKKVTKTLKVSKGKITSAQLKKLKKKTKYKVRIRAIYKKAGYQTVTSKWSATKTVKTK